MDDETAEVELVRTLPINFRLGHVVNNMSSWNRISTRHAKYPKE
jgi:hypothetical protein